MSTNQKGGTEVRVWMIRAGVKAAEISKELKVSQAAVSRFMSGENASRPIACYLIGKGCPHELVDVKTGRVAA